MADEDYEIDVYGDAQDSGQKHESGGVEDYADAEMNGHQDQHHEQQQGDAKQEADNADEHLNKDGAALSTTAAQQGVKRKPESDELPVDPGATLALLLSDLPWWNTEDDVRNWVHDAGCEDELKDITFSEHKVNGKSKGQAYVEFSSVHATTTTKRHIQSLSASDETNPGHSQQRHPTVSYHGSSNNPFRTLPKDAPQRARENSGRGAPAGPVNYNNNAGSNNNYPAGGGNGGFQGNFRGGRGGFNRGALRGGFNPNYGNSNTNAFNNNNMGGMYNPMGGGGFGGGGNFNRGGGMARGMPAMGAMRGRGGMMPGGMGMGMGGMPTMGMGGVPNMGLNMMGGMAGFNGIPGPFNQGFFAGANPANYGGNQTGGGGGGDWGNPHGAKRPRGE